VTSPAISLDGLTKYYGDARGVIDLDLEVERGEVFGFLGPNGAGKTTTIRLLFDLIRPTSGAATVLGLDAVTDTIEIRRRTGYLPGEMGLWEWMTTRQALDHLSALRGIEGDGHYRDLLDRFEVQPDRKIADLSTGNKQKVGIIQAFMHRPELLILDEPTTGLDPNQIVDIRELIKAIGREKTVILSTHILPEVQASCDRVLIIHRGKLVADGTPEDLQASFGGEQRIRFGVRNGSAAGVAQVLEHWGRVRILAEQPDGEEGTLFVLGTDASGDLRPDLFHLAVAQGWTLTELHRDQANLEDVFRQLTAA
jgi:ABC-2 type transport system ATP-binding protein